MQDLVGNVNMAWNNLILVQQTYQIVALITECFSLSIGIFHTLLLHRTCGKVDVHVPVTLFVWFKLKFFNLFTQFCIMEVWVYRCWMLIYFLLFCKFHYKQEGTYSIGTVGVEDVDCDFVDFTYVSWFQ